MLIFRQRKEDTIDENGENNEIVEELVGGDVKACASNRIPRREDVEGAR